MNVRQLFLLSPYRPPTSYPVSLSDGEAAAWLNAWAALWHPLALRGAVLPPLPASSYDHNEPAEGAIYALPSGPSLYLADDWKSKAEAAPALCFEAKPNRAETYAGLRQALGSDAEFDAVPATVVRWFAGIGFAHLMLDTLFEAMNHDKLLDLEAFWKDITDAVAVIMDEVAVKTKLSDAALKLLAARESLQPGGVQLVDIVLKDDGKRSDPWPVAFNADHPVTLIATAETLMQLKSQSPEQFEQLKQAVPGSVDFGVGVVAERDDALLPVESQLWSFTQARRQCNELLGVMPKLFGRGRGEYHPALPGWLAAAGFTGAVLLNCDGAMLPSYSSSIIQWPGPDGKIINTFTRVPLPASDAQTFFNLAYHLYDTSQRESTPLCALLHHGTAAAGYDDWLAICELAPVFGTWTGMESLLADSHTADYVSVPNADEFVIDTLDDIVTKRKCANPVSSFAKHHRLRRKLDSSFTLAALHRSLTAPTPEDDSQVTALETLENKIETETASIAINDLDTAENYWSSRLSERILARSAPDTPGYLILNPCGFTRRVGLEFANEPGPIPVDGAVKASEYEAGTARVVVEVPGLGFAWIPRGKAGVAIPKARIRTAEGHIVRNEFLEVEIDAVTGGMKAIRDTRLRVHRLGQLLHFNPGSRMVAMSVTVTHSGAIMGEIQSEGKLVDESDVTLAAFTQTFRAWVGRPVIEMTMTIKPVTPPAGYPWQHYYGSRFAWRDDRAAISRGVQGANSVSTLNRPLSPDYVEVRYGRERSFLFTGGLPFVQKQGRRMLDLVLIADGETETQFELLLAFDRDHPMPTATGWTAPTPVLPVDKGPPPMGASGWLASLDLPSLVLTSLRPCKADDGMSRAVTARFLETAGFASAAELRFARDPQRVSIADLNGNRELPVTMAGDAIPIACSAGELVNLKVEWNL